MQKDMELFFNCNKTGLECKKYSHLITDTGWSKCKTFNH